MKILQKTVRKSFQNWKPNPLVRCYHFASAFDGQKMICFTQNNPIKTHARAYRIGEEFNLPKYKEFPFFHSESRLIDKLLSKYNTISSNLKIVVMRINRCGKILGSKPCINCNKLLSSVGLHDIYYSSDDGNFIDSKQNPIYLEPFDQLSVAHNG